jgi:hypothetical protein
MSAMASRTGGTFRIRRAPPMAAAAGSRRMSWIARPAASTVAIATQAARVRGRNVPIPATTIVGTNSAMATDGSSTRGSLDGQVPVSNA